MLDLNTLKNNARKYQKTQNISYSKSLEYIAKINGFKSWNALIGSLKKDLNKVSITDIDFVSIIKKLNQTENTISKTYHEVDNDISTFLPYSTDNSLSSYRSLALTDMYAHMFKDEVELNPSLEKIVTWYETRLKNQGFYPCACMGPKENEPVCPCAMNDVIFVCGNFLFFSEENGFIVFKNKNGDKYKICNLNQKPVIVKC